VRRRVEPGALVPEHHPPALSGFGSYRLGVVVHEPPYGFERARHLKRRPEDADANPMAAEPELDRLDSVEAQALRSKYRCTMCQKRCHVPCRFTGTEFRELAATFSEGGTLPDVVPPPAGWDTPAGRGDV
jgi:hypothetical protein